MGFVCTVNDSGPYSRPTETLQASDFLPTTLRTSLYFARACKKRRVCEALALVPNAQPVIRLACCSPQVLGALTLFSGLDVPAGRTKVRDRNLSFFDQSRAPMNLAREVSAKNARLIDFACRVMLFLRCLLGKPSRLWTVGPERSAE